MKLISPKIKKILKVESLCSQPIFKEIKDRYYQFSQPYSFKIITDKFTILFLVDTDFWFDGRSGGKKLDFYAPNLGTLKEILCWLAHDLNAYGTLLSFDATNELLYRQLVDIAGYRKTKAWLIKTAVSIANKFDRWFGTPKKDDPEFINIGKFSVHLVEGV